MKQIYKTATRRIDEKMALDGIDHNRATGAVCGSAVGMLDVIAGRIADHINFGDAKNSNQVLESIASLLINNGFLAK